MQGSLSNYIRSHRRRAGLSQRELAKVIGYTKATVFRHEHTTSLPPLLTAFRYEILFATPVATLFAGVREAVEEEIEMRLTELEDELQRGRTRETRKQTLDWLAARSSTLTSQQLR